MIINHSKKFIFFANRKTASTSTAIALSSSCNHNDVITPLGRDEKIRRELGYQGPINFIPWWNKLNYFAIKAKCKLQKKASAAISNPLACTRTSKQELLSTRITSVHRHSKAITAFASFETHGTMLFPNFLNSKKTRDCSPSIWTPSSKAEYSTSSQGHADRSTATKEIFWSNTYIGMKLYRKQSRVFSTTSA